MMRLLAILLTIFVCTSNLYSPNSQAQDFGPPYSKVYSTKMTEQMRQREQKVREACFTQNWSQVQPVLHTKRYVTHNFDPKNQYNTGKLDLAITPIFSLVEAAGALNDFFYNVIKHPGRILLSRLIHQAYSLNGFRSLSYHQRACVAKCISANIIDYDKEMEAFIVDYKMNTKAVTENMLSFLHNSSIAASYEKGVCREFAKVYNFFARRFGVMSFGIPGPGHLFNFIRTKEGAHYLEPQDPACVFWSE